jgi:hypothetical protein
VGVGVGLEPAPLLPPLPVLSAPEDGVPVLLAVLPVLPVPVLPVPDGAAVDDAVAVVLLLLLAWGGFCAPHRLLTRHAVWQVESPGGHAATHWFPYSVHSKYGIVWE